MYECFLSNSPIDRWTDIYRYHGLGVLSLWNESLQIDEHDGDVVPAAPVPGQGDQLLARSHGGRSRRGGDDDVDGLLAGHLVPEAVGRDDEEAAVRGEAAARDLRLAGDPGLHGRVAERARHGQAVLHAPHAAAAAAHVPSAALDAAPLVLAGGGVVTRQRGRDAAAAAEDGAAVAHVGDEELAVLYQRRRRACAAACTLYI